MKVLPTQQKTVDTVPSNPDRAETCATLRVYGLIQGVGFRPFIARLAQQRNLSGYVRNRGSHVEIVLYRMGEAVAENFRDCMLELAPPAAAISKVAISLDQLTGPFPCTFTITDSEKSADKAITVPPDIAACEECLSEMQDPQDRRYGYPFINCTNCGPRFSIVKDLPYDRALTTMGRFEMCSECAGEYIDPKNRRYHAQPNACPRCGPQLALHRTDGSLVETETPVVAVIEALLTGKIVAIKSIGGFHLAVNAFDTHAIERLRILKKRDNKPFAVMARNVQQIVSFATISPFETKLLCSAAAPIVLLRKSGDSLSNAIAPKNPNIGVMLPSAPLHHLLLSDPRLPIVVMTSGNISSHPIVIENETALAELTQLADLILLNDRDIEVMVDDSVLRCSKDEVTGEEFLSFFRRGRGYAPYSFDAGLAAGDLLALGAELKTTVSVYSGGQIVMGQHIGDVKNDRTLSAHKRSAEHLTKLLACDPKLFACDAHPAFQSTRAALTQVHKRVNLVFHHHAHMAACMLENAIDGPCIGVIFDGAGYGPDGTIWGAEFLIGDFNSFERAATIRPIRLLGGDQAVKKPIRTAIALMEASFDGYEGIVPLLPAITRLPEDQREFLTRIFHAGINSPECSSMGRLFDGVAALVGLAAEAEYEAQGPIELEGLLERDLSMSASYPYSVTRRQDRQEIDYRPIIRSIAKDVVEGIGVEKISRRFHTTIVIIVCEMCADLNRRTMIQNIVLSGGVFLNEFLLVNSIRELRKLGLRPYHHSFFPSNDGGISAGQIAVSASQCFGEVKFNETGKFVVNNNL
jgi:hydrogenase maturation protein HypF